MRRRARGRDRVERLFGTYLPGHSVIHRLPAGVKLLALAAVGITAAAVPRPEVLAAAGVVTFAAFLLAGLVGHLARQLARLAWLILAVAAGQLLFALPVPLVVANTARMTIVIVLASLVTVTTPASQVLAALERGLQPLRRFGVDPPRVALTLSLTLRTVPVLARQAAGIRDAQWARSGRYSVTAFVVPLLVAALRQADRLADALAARGLDKGPRPPR